ncbi:hypothetical protein KBTX_03337 [wastewater metagenome]|uniref:Uncharacterized protein n=2 Tax=unclassified sequences TaxID=12908 RepID=A0A5B8RHM3_9ZZZZ|nr:hypothetical protein KBTEX_03337 [uncultured organism]
MIAVLNVSFTAHGAEVMWSDNSYAITAFRVAKKFDHAARIGG